VTGAHFSRKRCSTQAKYSDRFLMRTRYFPFRSITTIRKYIPKSSLLCIEDFRFFGGDCIRVLLSFLVPLQKTPQTLPDQRGTFADIGLETHYLPQKTRLQKVIFSFPMIIH
jgi:hypothetical protein